MRQLEVFIFLLVFASIFSVFSSFAYAAFEFNGTVTDVNGTALSGANVSVSLKDQTWADLGSNSTLTNATGWFNMTLTGAITDGYMYQLSIRHNSSSGFVDYVGQTLPSFPFAEFSRLAGTSFYLKEGGTINITVVNSSALPIPNNEFAYQVKDVKLGYPTGSCSNVGTYQVICYVPWDRNYSIMIYPTMGSPQHFVPVSFEWSNSTSPLGYNIGSLSNYTAATKTLNKQFNVTESAARISGYLNSSEFNITGWDELTIVPFLTEPGSMIFMTYGILPFNASAFFPTQNIADNYTLSRGNVNASAFYNITLPYAPAETVQYILFAAAKNGTYYGSYRNITVTGNAEINFTMRGLLGGGGLINMSSSSGGFRPVNISRQEFRLVNSTNNASLSNLNAHIETTVDYSNYGAIEFTFMEDISGANNGNFSLPLLNVTGIKEMNVYSMSFAPKRVPTRTVAQINTNNNITMASFNPGEIPGQSNIAAASISIDIYKSNSTCDVPNPPAGCSLASSSSMATFNPISAVIGGGKISFRMGVSGVLVHYVDVDMLASGPPDAMFEDNSGITESTTGGFGKAMRFGSNGPTIYSYVLISIPYTQGSTSTAGLNESVDANISIPAFYDENWNVAWNISLNGTNATGLAGNYSHYSAYQSQWETLMGNNTCIVTTTGTGGINITHPCHIDTASNRIWIRLPHFSGTGPSVSGSVTTVTSTTSTSTSTVGGTTTTTSNVTTGKVTKTYSSITPLNPKRITADSLNASGIHLTELYISVKNRVLSVEITIQKAPQQPASVTVNVSGRVYQWINITKTNLDDSNIDVARMQFRVEKTWINSNNIDADTIALYRWEINNRWNKMTTAKVSEDSTYLYYNASVPGFSYFVIAGELEAAPGPVCGDGACESGETYYNCPADCPAPECIEDWTCTEWSECLEEIQTRTCTDENSCGTTANKPVESQSCEIPAALPMTWIAIAAIIAVVAVIAVMKFKVLKKK